MNLFATKFFNRPTLTVARELLGQRLVRMVNGHRLSGLIVETEAYIGQADTACHANKGRTPRTEVMFGPPAQSYVYLIYGMYHMLNIVTEQAEFPAAVLIRAIDPLEGVARMQAHRPNITKPILLTNGPGKLCQALAIDKALDNWDITLGQRLWLEPEPPLLDSAITCGPRVGLTTALPKDKAAPWRFWVQHNRFVSKWR